LALHNVLVKLARSRGADIRTGCTVNAISQESASAHVTFSDGTARDYDLVVGCDGAHSKVRNLVFFPICFLLLMVPLNFLEDKIGFPLRMFVAKNATVTLNLIGVQARQRGSGIISPFFRFDVADPCSGIRSLMALTTVTAAYGYVTQHAQWKRWVLFLSAMPLAVLGNMARVTSIALVAQAYGQELATKTYHEYSGYIVFGVALSTMVIIGFLLNFPYRRIFQNWLNPPKDHGPHDDELWPPDGGPA